MFPLAVSVTESQNTVVPGGTWRDPEGVVKLR